MSSLLIGITDKYMLYDMHGTWHKCWPLNLKLPKPVCSLISFKNNMRSDPASQDRLQFVVFYCFVTVIPYNFWVSVFSSILILQYSHNQFPHNGSSLVPPIISKPFILQPKYYNLEWSIILDISFVNIQAYLLERMILDIVS